MTPEMAVQAASRAVTETIVLDVGLIDVADIKAKSGWNEGAGLVRGAGDFL